MTYGELALAIGLQLLVLPITTMHKEKMVIPPKKKRGRPFTGADNRDPVTAIRLSPQFRAAVDAWAAMQEDKPPRSEAIRRLVQRGLASDGVEIPSTAPAEAARASKPRKAAKVAAPKKTRQRRP